MQYVSYNRDRYIALICFIKEQQNDKGNTNNGNGK